MIYHYTVSLVCAGCNWRSENLETAQCIGAAEGELGDLGSCLGFANHLLGDLGQVTWIL